MASTSSSHHHHQGVDISDLTPCTVWKGENESDAELMEEYESPLA